LAVLTAKTNNDIWEASTRGFPSFTRLRLRRHTRGRCPAALSGDPVRHGLHSPQGRGRGGGRRSATDSDPGNEKRPGRSRGRFVKRRAQGGYPPGASGRARVYSVHEGHPASHRRRRRGLGVRAAGCRVARERGVVGASLSSQGASAHAAGGGRGRGERASPRRRPGESRELASPPFHLVALVAAQGEERREAKRAPNVETEARGAVQTNERRGGGGRRGALFVRRVGVRLGVGVGVGVGVVRLRRRVVRVGTGDALCSGRLPGGRDGGDGGDPRARVVRRLLGVLSGVLRESSGVGVGVGNGPRVRTDDAASRRRASRVSASLDADAQGALEARHEASRGHVSAQRVRAIPRAASLGARREGEDFFAFRAAERFAARAGGARGSRIDRRSFRDEPEA
jgi:hypothetical protein